VRFDCSKIPVSLTPGFSPVDATRKYIKPFQRFMRRHGKPLKRLVSHSSLPVTGLKPGVNEIVAPPIWNGVLLCNS
jgi:hypothetical protein